MEQERCGATASRRHQRAGPQTEHLPGDPGAGTSLSEKMKQNSENRHCVFIREKMDKGVRFRSLSGSVEAMKR